MHNPVKSENRCPERYTSAGVIGLHICHLAMYAHGLSLYIDGCNLLAIYVVPVFHVIDLAGSQASDISPTHVQGLQHWWLCDGSKDLIWIFCQCVVHVNIAANAFD